MKREELTNFIKKYCHSKMDKFLGKNIVDILLSSEITMNNFILQNKTLSSSDLNSLESFSHFLEFEVKFPYYTSEKLFSSALIELFKINNILFNKTSPLYKNFIVLEKWASDFNLLYLNYSKEQFQDQLLESIDLNGRELHFFLLNDYNLLKVFNEEQILQLKEIANDGEQNKLETIQLINRAIAIRLSTLDFNNMSYYLFKKLNNQQLQIQTYDQLTNFELYNKL